MLFPTIGSLKFERSILKLSHGLLLLRNRHFMLIDLLILLLAPAMALVLRTDSFTSLMRYAPELFLYTSVGLVVRLCIFLATGLYRRYWRFASLDELVLIGAVVVVSTTLVGASLSLINYVTDAAINLPRSIPLIEGLLVLLLVSVTRLSVRLVERWRRRMPRAYATRVAIMGAGVGGALCCREIESNPQLDLHVVGYIDDNPSMKDVRIHGARVLGNRHDIKRLAREYNIDQIIIAMPSVPGTEIRQIVEICERENIVTRTMPGLAEILSSGFSIDQVRKVELEDLLRRNPIETDRKGIQSLLSDKRVLVTGGGGSIGSELCRQILHCRPSKLIILGHGENSVFEINRELRTYIQKHCSEENTPQIASIIADIRFPQRLHHLFQEHKPEIVFHAAAHKHVPLMEAHPTEAVDNNILGTSNVLNASVAAGVERFVMISSDKAVNPTNVMGASKRCAELLVHQAAKESGLPYVAVRFGNVLGSRGSVVLTFKEQIARGGPVTVTHPDMQRFFMTIPEAVQLVLQAAVLGTGGEVFMLDMGEPVKISQLAQDLIELSGLEVDKDIEIKYSGLRPGEKLFEELFIEGETYGKTAHEKIMTAINASQLVPKDLDELVKSLLLSAQRNDHEAVIRLLQAIVPEYTPLRPDVTVSISQQLQKSLRVNGQLLNAAS